MIIKTLACVAVLAASPLYAQPATGIGTLQGSVTTPQGQLLPGSHLIYRQVVPMLNSGPTGPAVTGPVFTGEVTADRTGGFRVPGLPSGKYALCADVPSAAYLDPCVWAQPLEATVSANSKTSITVVLTKGAFLNVRVNDPARLLPHELDGPWTLRRLLVGVKYARGAYQGAHDIGMDSMGHDYQLIIPVGTPLMLWLFSRDLALVDGNGRKVSMPESNIQFLAGPGDQTFTFTTSKPGTQ